MKALILLLLAIGIFSSMSYGQSASFISAQAMATSDATSLGAVYNAKRNVYIDKNDIIHIFMFETGAFLLTTYPTTATEKDKFQLHMYTTKDDSYLFEAVGSYQPVLIAESSAPAASFAGGGGVVASLPLAVVGPFTNSVTFNVKHSSGGATYTTLNSSTIQVSKTTFVSIGSGFFYTPLKSPSNIQKTRNATGDSTLIADNLHGNGSLAVMATFYPGGRNSLMMPRSWYQDRLGIVVGTNIASSSANFKNFLLGVSYDFAYGGSIVVGANVDTQRQRILDVDYGKFEFGKTQYLGKLNNKLYKETAVSAFLGIQVDSRIFNKLFK